MHLTSQYDSRFLQPRNVEWPTEPNLIFIRADEQIVKVGSEVRLSITVTNNSDRVVSMTMSNPAVNYQVKITRPDGKFVSETDQMRRKGWSNLPDE
jgi:hypothetical protein